MAIRSDGFGAGVGDVLVWNGQTVDVVGVGQGVYGARLILKFRDDRGTIMETTPGLDPNLRYDPPSSEAP